MSGIIGNDWFDRETASTVTSVSDTKVAVWAARAMPPLLRVACW